jgi:predicted amidohydrolase YtcJ
MVRKFAVYNGNIHTMNPAAPQAEAVGIVEGRIVAVGTNDEVRAAVGGGESLDARGRTVVPGMIDAHLHFLSLSLDLSRVQLLGVQSIAAAVERATERAHNSPPGEWISGGGWNYNFLHDNRWPTKLDLDLRISAHPVAFASQDHHSLWVNSRALEVAGITRETPDPPDGLIMRDADGEPTGMLIEGAMRPVREAIPVPTPAGVETALRAGMREANRLGLTGAGSMEGPDALVALQRLRAAGGMTLRIYQSIPPTCSTTPSRSGCTAASATSGCAWAPQDFLRRRARLALGADARAVRGRAR